MEKIKIGLFIDTYFPMIDGVVMVVDNYAKRLKDIADVVVFCPKPKERDYKDDFSYKVVRSKRLKFINYDYCLATPRQDKNFMKQLKESNLDIVHIHSPFSIGKVGVWYAKKHNIPCIATLHSQFKRDFNKATHLKGLTNILLHKVISVFNKCDECWAVNSEIKNLYQTEYKLKAPTKVQNNGTEFALVEDTSEAERVVNEKFNIQKDEKVLLFVGRINVLKNILFIADSLKYVQGKIKFKMLYVGSGPDEGELKAKIKKLGLENEILMCGRVEDRQLMRQIYYRSDLFLFPSMYDASSLVQIEAASQKTPTIFLRGAKTAGTVTDGVNGFIVEPDEKVFAQKIVDVLNDEKLYNEISENAYRDLFVSWDKAVENAYADYLTFTKKIKSNRI